MPAAARILGPSAVDKRLRPVHALRRLLVAESDRLCAAVLRDVAKPADEALAGEVLPLADACRFVERRGRCVCCAAAGLAERSAALAVGPARPGPSPAARRRRHHRHLELSALSQRRTVNPGPDARATASSGSRPSSRRPAPRRWSSSLHRAGYPDGLVRGCGSRRARPAGNCSRRDIDHVVFTGSAATGRKVAEALRPAGSLSSTLELSGCDAMFVLTDADVPLAAAPPGSARR